MMHYYDKKYPYLQYAYTDGVMCSVPPKMLASVYKQHYGKKPKTFFDCGAAIGVVIKLAMDAGMNARGVDVRDYFTAKSFYNPLFSGWPFWIEQGDTRKGVAKSDLLKLRQDGRIQIKSILDCKPIKADLVYCNGILTYFDEATLPSVLAKFQNANMVCAIHNTIEDYAAAKQMGQELGTCQELKTVKPNDWWIKTFNQNGFDARFNHWLRCFVATPQR
ncbi:MAG: hypothetical protein IJU89_03155 [Alphaproteobacteria bacterium]|nr:hypothetical protein [Alphaproteobacteria bacterium]